MKNKYDKLRYAYMAELLRGVKEDGSSGDMGRLYKMFEGLCKKISWSFSEKYNLSFLEIEGLVCTEFMQLVDLYRVDSNMTLTSFLSQWLYLKVDRAIRKFLGKHKKYHNVQLTSETEIGDTRYANLTDKLVSPIDFNFHLEFSELVDLIRNVLGEVDVDIIILYGLYGMNYDQISEITRMSSESVRRHIRKIKKLLIAKTYGD